MPVVRRPVNPRQYHGNLPAPLPRYRPGAHIATTILPTSLVLATIPTKLPLRHIGNNPAGTFLTVPTVGPLPPVKPTYSLILPPPMGPHRPFVVPSPAMARRFPPGPMLNPGIPFGQIHRGHPGRIPILRR